MLKVIGRLTALILMLVAGLASAANVKWVSIEPNGWVFRVCVANAPTNGLFNFGWNTNNSGISKVRITVDSPGYDTEGSPVFRSRVVYGSKQLRFPYGVNGQSTSNYINDVTADGADVVIRCALSDYIFQNDTVENVSIDADWYSTNVGNSAVTVTNYSTLAFPKTIGKWTWPNYDRITGNSYTLRCVAFNRFGQNGSPVAAVQFWATDAHGHSVTNSVSRMSIDPTLGDAVPICEFITTMDASTLTPGDIITNNFRALPWIGDTDSVLDTSDGLYSAADPYYAPLYFLADQDNQYGTVSAVVDAVSGTATGAAITTPLDTSAPPDAFASISQAAHAIEKTNSIIYGHDDVGGGIIYLRGNNSWTGTSASPSSARGKTWLVITNYPDELAAISSKSGPGNINGLIKISGVTISANSAFTFSGVSNLWFDHCTFDVTNSSDDLVDGAGFHWVTDCVVTNFDQGFLRQGTQNTVWALVRGTSIFGKCPASQPYCFIGNLRDATNRTGTFLGSGLPGLARDPQQVIVAFNKLLKCDYSTSTFLSFYNATNCADGAAFCQNLIESVNTNSDDALFVVHGDENTSDATNVIIVNNTIIGGKYNVAYDDLGNIPHFTVLWREANNIIGDGNRKSDTFSGYSLDSNRTGNWPLVYGVGSEGDVWLEYSHGAPGNFLKEFAGLDSYQPSIEPMTQPPAGSSNLFYFPAFVQDNSWNGTNSLGNGDYHLTYASMLRFGVPASLVFPFDIDGVSRESASPPGAYSSIPRGPRLAVSLTTNAITVSLATQTGVKYTLERSSDLTNAPWQPVSTLSGDGTEQPFTDQLDSTTQNFYRVRASLP